MQKRIVNDAINLRKFDLLVLYCGIYLVAVIAASILKYLINILQTIIGQRTLADMRQALYAHMLTMPLSFYRKTQPGLDDRILVLQQTGLFTDVPRFGLNAVLDKNDHKDIIRQILNVRKIFRQDFGEDLSQFIEFYNSNNYLHHSSVAENIIFGDPQDNTFNPQNLPQNDIFIEFSS